MRRRLPAIEAIQLQHLSLRVSPDQGDERVSKPARFLFEAQWRSK